MEIPRHIYGAIKIDLFDNVLRPPCTTVRPVMFLPWPDEMSQKHNHLASESEDDDDDYDVLRGLDPIDRGG